jgi:PIN domain nuclease of toxin-antitoxin system
MRILLDTHVLIWALVEPHRLSAKVQSVLENPENDVLFSAASIWEIAIKFTLGRESFPEPRVMMQAALDSGFTELPIRSGAAALVATMPMHHRDPFDRLLVAQAMSEPAHFYTADDQLKPYSELVERI